MIEWWRDLERASPLLAWALAAHLAAIPLAAIAMTLDSRELLGVNIWVKPLKFLISTSLFMATAAFLIRFVASPTEARWIGSIIAVSMIVENVLISMQAMRGERSHFNVATPFNGAVFNVMGLFIVANTVAMAWLFLVSMRAPAQPIGAGLLTGIRTGLALFLAGSLQAGFMLRIAAHTVGAPDGGPGLPIINFSRMHGDLRVAHAVGLHAIQVLPIAGLLVDRFSLANPAVTVIIAAVLYGGLFVLVLLQALAGKPLWP